MRKFCTVILTAMFVLVLAGWVQAKGHDHAMHHNSHNPFEVSKHATDKHKKHCALMGHNLQRPCPHKSRHAMDPDAPDVLATECGGLPMSSKAHPSHSAPHPLAFSTKFISHSKFKVPYNAKNLTAFISTVLLSTDPPPRFL